MQKDSCSISAAALSVLTAVLAAGPDAGLSARTVILCGLLHAVCLTAILGVVSGALIKSGTAACRAVSLVLGVWLLAELWDAVVRAQNVCRQEFHSMALIGLLPFLFWAGVRLTLADWDVPARVLWWFVLLGGVVCLAGICGQMDWTRLLTEDTMQSSRELRTPLYAEYLLYPLLCPEKQQRTSFLALPWLAFLVQAGTALGMGLVFGAADYPAKELLRAWSVGVFSRMDSLLLLIWLTCSIFRIGFLCASIRALWQQVAGHRTEAAQ